MIPGHWQAVTRDDGETVGYVESGEDGFVGRDLLGHELDRVDAHDEAEAMVRERGLASLGRYWDWTDDEGDLRTPTGLYMIVDKRPHPRWRHFLLLDYPNLQDLHRYWLAIEVGKIPRRGDGYAGIGGAVGIHGTDRPSLNRAGEDWTFGCISLSNGDVDDLASLVPVGTLVLIED